MRLTDLSVDAFGVLSNLRIENLSPGLNVVHGPNGSGKTTLLHFLRGVWCGFDDARRRRFLPPLTSGQPGGSIGVVQGERSYHITRQALPNATDRLAVSIRRGSLDDTASLRGSIDALSPEVIEHLYVVGNSEAHSLDRLLELAVRDGISLETQRRRSTRFESQLATLADRRRRVFGGDGVTGETERLHAECRTAQAELAALQAQAERLRNELSQRFEQAASELDRLARRVEWLDLERQGLETNLSETEDVRIETVVARPAADNSVVVECRPHDELQDRVRDLDHRIAHARAVLEDLARSRMQVSHETARVAGFDPADVQLTLQQQRALLRALEQETLQLRDAGAGLAARSSAGCRCPDFDARIQQAVRAMQQHIYLLCQQLTRQEQAQRQWQLLSERSQIDSCEAELMDHVARLQRERTELLAGAREPHAAALRHQSHLEQQTCGCSEHHHFADRTTAKVRLQVAPAPPETVRTPDPRRPDWRRRLAELNAELDRTQAAWRDAVKLRAEWDIERARLIALERRMAAQQIEVESRERLLAERIEEGQSLVVAEAGLERIRDQMFDDEPAQVIADASQLLSEMTGGRYRSLLVTLNPLQLSAVNETGLAIPSHALSRGMLDQVGLALRIALSDEYARRGVNLPLILDDVLSDSDPGRVDCAIRILQGAAERRQIIFLTCQEHLAARFEAAGVEVRDFPGTRRQRLPAAAYAAPLRVEIPAETADRTRAAWPMQAIASVTSLPMEDSAVAHESEDASVHPGEPHWLRVDSPVSTVPSVGEQMSRRLSAAGVRTIGDLVVLDPEEADLPIHSLQIAPAQWRIWQAEGRLLACVPHLTGRDAQLLAAVGVLTPQELAECDADALVRRIDRLRGDGRSGWVMPGFVWPDRNVVSAWVENGRRARTFREACDAAGWTSSRSSSRSSGRGERGRGRHFRVDQPSRHRGPRVRRRVGPRRRATATLGQFHQEAPADQGERESDASDRSRMSFASHAASGDASASSSEPTRLRFYLDLQSPIVDAPSIGPTTARRLERVGVMTVADLLQRDAQQIVDRLQHRRITTDAVRQWQDQSRLMCQVPELRGHDAQVLVACGLRDPETVGRHSPQSLFGIVGPFVATKEGQRLLRSARSPDLAEVTDWITWAQQARSLKAA